MSLEINFLGSGSAFTLAEENYQSNILISKDNKHLLYDAGSTIAEALNSAGLVPQDLDTIYISHLHDDHAGGVEYIGFKTYFEVFKFNETEFGSMKPRLIGHHSILREGWDNCWKGGLQSIQGQTNTLESYFNTTYMSDDDTFNFYGTEIWSVPTSHVKDNIRDVPSFGILCREGDKKVFISGDTMFTPEILLPEYRRSDIIFHDCEFSEYSNSVHAQFHQLCTLENNIKEKMWLYHYSLNGKTYEELESEVLENGFAGLVKRGQKFKI